LTPARPERIMVGRRIPMALCPVCSRRKAKRLCPVLGKAICPLCCVERRRADDPDCPGDCPFNAKAREVGRLRTQAVTRRHGPWLSRRVRAFGKEIDLFKAALDLEEALCAYGLVRSPLEDREVLEALDFLDTLSGEVVVVLSPPNGLAAWLQDAWKKGGRGPLASFSALDSQRRRKLLEELKLLARGEGRLGGYIQGATAFFREFRKAQGKDDSWFRKIAGGGRGERGALFLG